VHALALECDQGVHRDENGSCNMANKPNDYTNICLCNNCVPPSESRLPGLPPQHYPPRPARAATAALPAKEEAARAATAALPAMECVRAYAIVVYLML